MEQLIKKYVDRRFAARQEGDLIVYNIPLNETVEICKDLYYNHKLPFKIMTAVDERSQGQGFKIFYVFGAPEENIFIAPYVTLDEREEFPSITNDIHEAADYERKIKSFFGLNPVGHPGVRQILLHENWPDNSFPLRKDFAWNKRPAEAAGKYEFHKVEGEGIYEIPVGPVHAGIIEPGHFRFSMAGEEIVLLEPKLGYKHKGIEKLFEVLPFEDKLKLSERVSGDSSFSHSLAYAMAIEALAGIEVPKRAKFLRVIFSELERLANHFNDIGFIMLDTGYNFGGANGARLREMIMRWNERLSGSRFLRGLNTIGGLTKDLAKEDAASLTSSLDLIKTDFDDVIEVAENSSSLLNRLRGTGRLDPQIAKDHGVVGVAGRAVGIETDTRINFPYAAYDQLKLKIAGETAGDVYARFKARVKEVYSSLSLIKQALEKMPAGPVAAEKNIKLKKNSYTVSLVEGWRGEIVYFVATDEKGNISRVEPSDPSFLNWPALGYAGKGNLIPDFPLINKSFNLSYSGNDL